MTTLPTTIDPPADYTVMVVEAAAPGWLHLPSLHAKLLPLALAAGHETLQLGCDYTGAGDFECTYNASCSGGPSKFRQYINQFGLEEGHLPADFERVLTAKLQQQADFLALTKEAA
jgi:hypothetical protein